MAQRVWIFLLCLLLGLGTMASAQSTQDATSRPAVEAAPQPANATQPASQPATQHVPQAATAPTSRPASPIPLAEVVSRAGGLRTQLKATDADLANNPTVSAVKEHLPILTADIAARRAAIQKVLTTNPTLDVLRAEQTAWRNMATPLAGWRQDLTARAAALDDRIASLQDTANTWRQTLAAAQAATLPAEVLKEIQSTLNAIDATRAMAERRRDEALLLQSQVATQADQVDAALESLSAHQGEILGELFAVDSPPIWSPRTHMPTTNPVQSFPWQEQFTALTTYFTREQDRFTLHLVLLGLLTAGMFWARSRFEAWAKAEKTLEAASPAIRSPLANAVILSVLLSIWIHPQAPRLFWSISAALAIVPAAILVGRFIATRFHILLYVLVLLFFVDQLRTLLLPLPAWPRIVFILEMGAAALFLAWFMRTHRQPPQSREGYLARRRRLAAGACRLAILLMTLALLAAVVGYTKLAYFLGSGVIRSAFVGVILYAGLTVADGIVILLLHLRPVAHFAAIKRHMPLIRFRIRRVLSLAVILYWLTLVLRFFLLFDVVYNSLRWLLITPVEIGAFSLSLGQLAVGIFTVWASFAISRFVRFLLEEDVYPHVRLPRGLGNALATIIHYAVLVIGFAMALAALGFPVTQLTILTGAFGVGLGFGLQTIINNFFSGLIVLAERPIQVGDVIEMDGFVGTVTRIGIRATVMHTPTGSEVILPNARLINERVINWTLSGRARGIEIPVNVDPAVPVEQVTKLLEQAAASHPAVSKFPPPRVELTNFTPGALTFTLRVWTTNVADWQQARSEVALAVYAALRKENIALK